jgi:hypothetical protein
MTLVTISLHSLVMLYWRCCGRRQLLQSIQQMKRDKHLYPLSWGDQHGLAFAHQLEISLKERFRTIGELIGQVESFWKFASKNAIYFR